MAFSRLDSFVMFISADSFLLYEYKYTIIYSLNLFSLSRWFFFGWVFNFYSQHHLIVNGPKFHLQMLSLFIHKLNTFWDLSPCQALEWPHFLPVRRIPESLPMGLGKMTDLSGSQQETDGTLWEWFRRFSKIFTKVWADLGEINKNWQGMVNYSRAGNRGGSICYAKGWRDQRRECLTEYGISCEPNYGRGLPYCNWGIEECSLYQTLPSLGGEGGIDIPTILSF